MAQAHDDVSAKKEDVKPAESKRETLHMPLAEPAKGDEKPKPTIGVRGEPIEDGERDPDTIAEEQRRRSEEYEKNLGSAHESVQESKDHKLPPPAKK